MFVTVEKKTTEKISGGCNCLSSRSAISASPSQGKVTPLKMKIKGRAWRTYFSNVKWITYSQHHADQVFIFNGTFILLQGSNFPGGSGARYTDGNQRPFVEAPKYFWGKFPISLALGAIFHKTAKGCFPKRAKTSIIAGSPISLEGFFWKKWGLQKAKIKCLNYS